MYSIGKDTSATELVVPFFKDIMPQLGLLYVLLAYFVIVGTSNAVNLTDGLDGLAIMPTVFVAAGFALVAWATGNVNLPLICIFLTCAMRVNWSLSVPRLSVRV